MSYYTLELTQRDRYALQQHAIKMGYPSLRHFFEGELAKFAQQHQDMLKTTEKSRKYRINWEIPKEMNGFYEKLATYHGSPVSNIISRYIMMPHLNSLTTQQGSDD